MSSSQAVPPPPSREPAFINDPCIILGESLQNMVKTKTMNRRASEYHGGIQVGRNNPQRRKTSAQAKPLQTTTVANATLACMIGTRAKTETLPWATPTTWAYSNPQASASRLEHDSVWEEGIYVKREKECKIVNEKREAEITEEVRQIRRQDA